MSIEQLVEQYSAAAAAHGRATLTADDVEANRASDQIARIYSELRARGLAAQRALLRLLTDADASVRLWAGAHALEFSSVDGESVLLEIVEQERGLIGFTARMTLQQWQKGELRFP